MSRIEGKVSVGWKSFQFLFHNFAALDTTEDHYIASPEFTCNGHQWELRLYPGGESDATEGYVSAHLCHLSEGSITATFKIRILDKEGNVYTEINEKEGATNRMIAFDTDELSDSKYDYIITGVLHEIDTVLVKQ